MVFERLDLLYIPSCIRLPDRLDGVPWTLMYNTNHDGGNATLQYRSYISQLDVKSPKNVNRFADYSYMKICKASDLTLM